jgi:hypothetical protein
MSDDSPQTTPEPTLETSPPASRLPPPENEPEASLARRRPPRQTRDALTWAFRLFMGRDPRDTAEMAGFASYASLDELRAEFIRTAEFQEFLDTVLPQSRPRIGVPISLLRPPLSDIPWRFEAPTLDTPVSQLCTAAQFDEPAAQEIMKAMGMARRLHRSNWQQLYVVSVLATLGCIAKGRSAIGLGTTRQRIAALLASRGLEVMAMGRPGATAPEEARGGYHLFFPEVVRLADFELLVHFAEQDLKEPDLDLGGPYDICWSCDVAQHMGHMDEVLGLVESSLNLLKPGGVAVHTLDFNIGSDTDTIEGNDLTVPRRRDIEVLVQRLVRAGHEVLPVNLHPGHDFADGVVDLRPYSLPHLKVQMGDHVVTSLGLAIRRGG